MASAGGYKQRSIGALHSALSPPKKMFEEKLLAGVASLASLAAIGTVLLVIPNLYNTINELHDEIIDGVQVCLAAETNSSGLPRGH